MKDYRLSEIKEICKEYNQQGVSCDMCAVKQFCYDGLDYLLETDIEPRDMIELPYKQVRKDAYSSPALIFQVLYRDEKDLIRYAEFCNEQVADAFIEMKRGEQK